MTEKKCENCAYRKGIVCDLDGGHIGFDWYCDEFKMIDGDME